MQLIEKQMRECELTRVKYIVYKWALFCKTCHGQIESVSFWCSDVSE